MTQSTVQSFFGGGAGKYAKFEKVGDKIKGKIVAVHPPEPATDPQGKPKTDKNGRVLLQLRIELQTDERNPEIEFDDGQRTLYVQSFMIDAVKEALHKAGAQEPEMNGDLEVVLDRLEPNPPPMNPSKKFAAVYEKPSSTAASKFFDSSSKTAGAMTKPGAISQAAWDAMDSATQAKLAETMSGVSDQPPF